jgi:hypothetical protein
MRNRAGHVPVSTLKEWNTGCVMENTEKFRQYAEDCRRLAERAAPKDRAVLIEISNAWAACAAEAERKKQNGKATDFRDAPPPLAR